MPGSQPSALAQSVPGKAERTQLESEVAPVKIGDSGASATSAAPTDPSAAPNEQDSLIQQLASEPDGSSTQTDLHPEQQSLIDQIASDEAMTEVAGGAKNPSDIQVAGPDEQNPLSMGQEFKARVIGKLGRNVSEQKSLFEKALGKDFEVTTKGDELFFRKKGSKKYFPVDKEAFTGGLREMLMDTADLGGDALEVGGNVAGEAASVAAGTAVGGPVGAVAGAIGGAPVAAATGIALRQAAIDYFGGDSSTNLKDEMMMGTGINLATLGLGAALKSGIKGSLNIIKDVLESQPKVRLGQLAQVRKEVETVASELGSTGKQSVSETGQEVFDAVTKQSDMLDDKMKLLREQSVIRASDKVLPADNYRQSLSEVLKKYGIDDANQSMLRNPKARAEIVGRLEKSNVPDEVIGFLDDHVMEDLANIDKTGGITMDRIWNTADNLKRPGGYNQGGKVVQLPTQAMGLARSIRQGIAKDRDAAVETLFKGTPEGEYLSGAIKEYSEKIDGINDFKKMFQSSKSSERFMKGLIKSGSEKMPASASALKDFKYIVGDDSTEFKNIQAVWMDDVMKKGIDPSTGIVKGKAITKYMDSFEKDFLDEMLTPMQQKALRFSADKAEKIPYLDMLTPGSQQAAQDYAQIAMRHFDASSATTRLLWNLFRGNADAAKYLKNEGLLEIALKMKDPEKRSMAMKTIEMFQKMLQATDVVRTKDGRNVLRKMDFDQKLKDPKAAKVMSDIQQKWMQKNGGMVPEASITAPGAGAFSIGQGIKDSENDAGAASE